MPGDADRRRSGSDCPVPQAAHRQRARVVLEVVDRPRPGTYLVASGFGARAQWLRNVAVNPQTRVYARGHRPATARLLTSDETAAALAAYAAGHPRMGGAEAGLRSDSRRPDQRPGTSLPVIALELAGGAG